MKKEISLRLTQRLGRCESGNFDVTSNFAGNLSLK
jgi:hypothetical protein